MTERPADAFLVVAVLGFGNRQVLASSLALVGVTGGQSVEGVGDRSRSLMIAGRLTMLAGSPFEIDLGRPAGCSARSEAKPR